jgi:3',5'-cyclic AMP phosphodiesterase CpdA
MFRRSSCFIAAFFIFCSPIVLFAAGERPVLIVGDSQHDKAAQERIVAGMVKENPIAVFSLGDQVDNGNDPSQWEEFNRITRSLRAITKYYPALGNHDNKSPLYFMNFNLTYNERWYTVIENSVRFIVLDSTSPLDIDSEQYHWLKEVLAQNQKEGVDFVILLFHHPLFTTTIGHKSDEKGWGEVIFPLFQEYPVDIVFSGHSHNYERSFYNGIYYIVSGGGGSTLVDQGTTSPYSQVFVKRFHYLRLDNRDGLLAISAFDIDGALIDKIEIVSKRRSSGIKELETVGAFSR